MDKKTQKTIDSVLYVIFCILTLGGLWLSRIIITKGVLFALEQKDKE